MAPTQRRSFLWQIRRLCLAVAFCVGLSHTAAAQVAGTVEKLLGQAQYLAPDVPAQPLREGQTVQVGATIITSTGSETHLDMADGGMLAIRPQTHFTIAQYNAAKGTEARMELNLLQGALRSITGWIGQFNAGGYRITTPTATVGIRGTDHEVTVLLDAEENDVAGTYDSVHEGATVLRNRTGDALELQAGEDGIVESAQEAAPRRMDVRPGFFLRRKLLLEERVEQRRAVVLQRLQEALAQHPEKLQALRERMQRLAPAQREALKRQLRRQHKTRPHGQ